jgi:hypothetical protein
LSIENCNGISGLELADQREEYMEIVFAGRKVVDEEMVFSGAKLTGSLSRIHSPTTLRPAKTISMYLSSFGKPD